MFVLLLVTGAAAVIRRGNKRQEWIFLIFLAGLGLAFWGGLRPRESTGDASDLNAYLALGKPVLLEFQSPY